MMMTAHSQNKFKPTMDLDAAGQESDYAPAHDGSPQRATSKPAVLGGRLGTEPGSILPGSLASFKIDAAGPIYITNQTAR